MINFLFAQLQREARTEEWLRPLSTRLKVSGVTEVLDLDPIEGSSLNLFKMLATARITFGFGCVFAVRVIIITNTVMEDLDLL